MAKETRVFRGETATSVNDGWSGYRIGQTYELEVEYQGEAVLITMDHHEHIRPGTPPKVLTRDEYERWFKE